MKDHRQLGREMDLFMFSELAPGSPIWLPNGNIVYSLLQEKIRKLQEKTYHEVRTPVLWKSELYKKSGHLEHYAKNMFFSGEEYALKPMNCPGHMEIFKSKGWSIRDLPYRISDFGTLHRNEPSGALGGLTRCVAFCQDDAHIFLALDQIEEEVSSLIGLINKVYYAFKMDLRVALSTRPDNFLGEKGVWDTAETLLKNALKDFEESPKDGAFYGPKIDFFVKDNLGREWQTATIQLDFQLPQRFELEYTDHDNNRKTPVVIHRAIFGSFERLIGILLEHFQGNLPFWLSLVQVAILPVSDKHLDYAFTVKKRLLDIRTMVDDSNNRLSQKVAIAQSKHVNIMAIVGNKEIPSAEEYRNAEDFRQPLGRVSVRMPNGQTDSMEWLDFYKKCSELNRFEF